MSSSSSRFSTFRARSFDFRLADTDGELRDELRRIGLEQEYGLLETGQTVDGVVTLWLASRATVRAPAD